MIRQNIILGDYTYIADLFVTGEDKEYMPVKKKFVMIKNSNVLNDIVYDTEVYFIEKEIIDECVIDTETGLIDKEKLGSMIAFPIMNSKITGYSNDYTVFNDNFSEESFKYGIDIYPLLNKNYYEEYVTCDTLRIYFPTIKASLNAILCVSTYINNIKFYFVCKQIDKYEIKSETEFTVDHTNYSEFIDVYIPNINLLFKKDNLYIAETSNINEIRQSFKYSYNENANVTFNLTLCPKVIKNMGIIENVTNKLKISLVSCKKHKVTFDIISTVNSNTIRDTYKTDSIKYGVSKETLSYNLLTVNDVKEKILAANPNIDITFNHTSTSKSEFLVVNYVYKDDDYELQLPDDLVNLLHELKNTDIYYNFECSDVLELDNNITNLILEINGEAHPINISLSKYKDNGKLNIVELQSLVLPFLIEPVTDPEYAVVQYKKVYVDDYKLTNEKQLDAALTVVLYPYSEFDNTNKIYLLDENVEANADTFTQDYNFDIGASLQFNKETGSPVVKSTFTYPHTTETLWEAYCKHYNVKISDYINYNPEDEESEEYEIDTSIELLGYRIEIATDNYFTNIIYALDKSVDMNNDAAYFIDDFEFELSSIFNSWDNVPPMLNIRTMFIDKMLRNTFISNIVFIPKEKIKYLINDETRHRTLSLLRMQANPNEIKKNTDYNDMDLTKFNFIDKITCVVKKPENVQAIGSNNSGPKIIYKPIFYKVAALSNIKLKAGLNQNIGVNLGDLMTKVETFKMVIGDTQYVETARNDIYTIFNIDAAKLKGTGGTYSIVNQDDEYISSGTWSTY